MYVKKHSLALRIFHWVNVPVLSLLIWSGILIYWAHQAYIPIPVWFAKTFSIEYRLAEGMGWHFFLMWIFSINGLLFSIYLFTSGHWREILPRKHDLKVMIPFILSDLGLSKKTFNLDQKYNPPQRLAYTSAFVMALGAIITGLAIYKPVQLNILTTLLGGYEAARFEHFMLMTGLICFILIHIIQVVRSGWRNVRLMISGLAAALLIIILPAIFIFIKREPAIFRYSFMTNEKLWSIIQSTKRLNSGYSAPLGKPARVNGLIGLKSEISSKNYSITMIQPDRELKLPLSELYLFPKRGYVVEFRCIEGWSEDTQYAGVRFSELMEKYNLGKKSDGTYYAYVGLETPDEKYYVSIDMESMLHEQTILAWERNGKGLSLKTGFPIRLHIPIKYGIKSLKRVGKIIFSDKRPRDYWAERGYDWYSGL